MAKLRKFKTNERFVFTFNRFKMNKSESLFFLIIQDIVEYILKVIHVFI